MGAARAATSMRGASFAHRRAAMTPRTALLVLLWLAAGPARAQVTINGGWSAYTACAPGTPTAAPTGVVTVLYTQTRLCNSPAPQGGGFPCVDSSGAPALQETRECGQCIVACAAGLAVAGTCDPGAQVFATECVVCQPGYACNGTHVRACHAPEYQPYMAQASCELAPGGWYVEGDPGLDAAPCAAGHYCTAGVQHECGAGRFQRSPARTFCVNISPGYFCAAGTLAACTDVASCGITHYCPGDGTRLVLEPGFYGNNGAFSSAPVPCPPGAACSLGTLTPCANAQLETASPGDQYQPLVRKTLREKAGKLSLRSCASRALLLIPLFPFFFLAFLLFLSLFALSRSLSLSLSLSLVL